MANKADLVRNRQVKAAGKLKIEVLTEYSIPFIAFAFVARKGKLKAVYFF